MQDISPEILSQSPNGRHATFIALDGYGIKLFSSPGQRDYGLGNQRILAEHELAPDAWGPFESEINGKRVWGFCTEIADCKVSAIKRGGGDGDYWSQVHSFDLQADMQFLNDKLVSVGAWKWNDLHAGNVGYMHGRMVLIDCNDDLGLPIEQVKAAAAGAQPQKIS